jgi:acyl carrier protein
MDREQLRKQLADILENETGNRPAVLTDGIKLKEELGLDSVDVVSLIMQIEAAYRIRLTREELEPIGNVGDLLSLLQRKMATGNAGKAAA